MVVVCSTDVPGDHLCLIPPDALRDGVSPADLVPLTELDGETVANPSVSPDGHTVVFDRVAERDDPLSTSTCGGSGSTDRMNASCWSVPPTDRGRPTAARSWPSPTVVATPHPNSWW